MAEDLKSKLAAINAAKVERERVKKQEDEKQKGEKEATLRDKSKAMENRIVEAEQSAKEAEEAMQQAEAMLVEGALEDEERAAVEGIKAEAQQKIDELNEAKAELANIQAQIEELNAKPDDMPNIENTTETTSVKKVETAPLTETEKKLQLQQQAFDRARTIRDELLQSLKTKNPGDSSSTLGEKLGQAVGLKLQEMKTNDQALDYLALANTLERMDVITEKLDLDGEMLEKGRVNMTDEQNKTLDKKLSAVADRIIRDYGRGKKEHGRLKFSEENYGLGQSEINALVFQAKKDGAKDWKSLLS